MQLSDGLAACVSRAHRSSRPTEAAGVDPAGVDHDRGGRAKAPLPGDLNATSTGAEVTVEHVRKTFEHGSVVALEDVSFQLEPGEFVSLTGPSGCGKSTLLNLLGALDRPDTGSIAVAGERLERLTDAARYRAETVGFVFQLHHLMPALTVAENVQVPLLGRRYPRHERERRAVALLEQVGLRERTHARPATLSGGERQRVAIARALANQPRLLLADEPTAAVDTATGRQIVELFRRLRGEYGMTILLVTNDGAVAATADRIIHLRDGRLVELMWPGGERQPLSPAQSSTAVERAHTAPWPGASGEPARAAREESLPPRGEDGTGRGGGVGRGQPDGRPTLDQPRRAGDRARSDLPRIWGRAGLRGGAVAPAAHRWSISP